VSRATSRRYNTAPNSGPGGAQAIAAEQETQSPAHDTLETTFNAWLYERLLTEQLTLKGALVIAPQDPKAGAADIRRYAGKGNGHACTCPHPGVRPLYGRHSYDPIYEAAVETGLPVCIHSVEAVFPAFPFQLDEFQTSMAQHCIAHPFTMMANGVSMIETAVCRCAGPKVRIADGELRVVL
jgi:predicted TIM-barrel fold metal-dependent hydrolase